MYHEHNIVNMTGRSVSSRLWFTGCALPVAALEPRKQKEIEDVTGLGGKGAMYYVHTLYTCKTRRVIFALLPVQESILRTSSAPTPGLGVSPRSSDVTGKSLKIQLRGTPLGVLTGSRRAHIPPSSMCEG